ncbi:putative protein N(5)-glutamine methyltransferase [Arthrobacter sp. HY1533]|uniref:putative protein N(5)-glutamine methyltransferase n=1 Tax=Arthrobacter sp. HY1533 TaxID=2970919 RepID=UPI0022B9DF83|nr:putative protein N(5)-glutamine methyltransferase [Arthrobacter sp. HY1533]
MEQSETLPEESLVSGLRLAGCVFAEEEAAILLESARTDAELAMMLARRIEGQPLEHIVGWAQFCGFRVKVAPGVFVPRRRSEFLVEQALAALAGRAGRPVVLDLCCGSGAVGVAIARSLAAAATGCELHAADVDPAAVVCATANLAPFGGSAHCGDLFAALPQELRGGIDLIAANAPYVPAGAIAFMPQEARLHEPERALNGGADGLDLHRRIAREASQWLRPGGSLLLESSARQAPLSAAILASCGLTVTIASHDELDATVVAGMLSPAGELHIGR